MIRPPPSAFPAIADTQIEVLHPSEIDLHRLHSRNIEGDSFNPCLGQPTRFAPIYAPAKGTGTSACIPTLYAGSSFECAAFESVFHDVPLTATSRTVPEQRILSVAHSRLRFQTPLRLVKLYTPDIGAAWQLKRTDLIDTPASDYRYTAPWALAIHEARADIHGLIWTSRRYDPQRSTVLWGDRVPASMLQATPKQPADRGSSVYVQLHAVAAAYNIVITL